MLYNLGLKGKNGWLRPWKTSMLKEKNPHLAKERFSIREMGRGFEKFLPNKSWRMAFLLPGTDL